MSPPSIFGNTFMNHSLTRRQALQTLSAASAIAIPGTVWASKWPEKPIRLMVGFPAGGGADAMARTIGSELQKLLGSAVIVENKNGATGTICGQFVAQAAPDGYTLMLAHISSNAIGPLLLAKGKYHPLDDFTPIGLAAITPHLLVVNPKLPVKTVPELIALAKAKPGKLTFMSAGMGSAPHLAGESFKLAAGVDVLHVPFKGTGEAITSLLAGEVDMTFSTTGSTMQHVKAGKLRAIATCSAKRLHVLPDLPAVAETLKGYEATTWYGLAGPAKLPPELVKRLESALQTVLRLPHVQTRFGELDAETRTGSAADFRSFWQAELAKYAQLIAKTNLQMS